MWTFDEDFNKWYGYKDNLSLDNFNFFKQQLDSVRLYSKCLSGATYLPVNDVNNLYDVLGEYEPRNWYVSIVGSSYSNTLIPGQYAKAITATSSYEYFTKYLSEYGLTLKNHFTPNRIIREFAKNYVEVDVATTIEIDLTLPQTVIDDVTLIQGHRVLVKDQIRTVVLLNTENPEDFILGDYEVVEDLGATIEYSFYDESNGIYEFNGTNLIKLDNFLDYEQCIRSSILVKLGTLNESKQFHLKRLRNGYFPVELDAEPFHFIEKKNWILRNRVDYNNLFEINYFDVLTHSTQSYFSDGITYSVPERYISVGEFGVILNTQNGISNIIPNLYKVNLRSISQTEKFYWMCGDDGILLRVNKNDFTIKRIEVDCLCPRKLVTTDLYCISFFNSLNGVAVGELNTVLITNDGGTKWERIRIPDFDAFTFTQCLYYSLNSFFVAGSGGIFIEFTQSIYGWSAVRKRISRFVDDDDEYVLVDRINHIFKTTLNSWGLSYSFSTQSTSSNKELLFIAADDSKIIAYDINNSIPDNSFLYLDFPSKYGDIKTVTRRSGTNTFYFSGTDPLTGNDSIYSFDINSHNYIGVGNSYSNTAMGITPSTEQEDISPNRIFDYNGNLFFVCGNNSLLKSSTYSSINLNVLDDTFESKLKSKMLFLDYDMGSKLSFFTDFGEYRLPNSLIFTFTASTTSFFSFEPLVYGATSPSFLTQSETNWMSYWQDVNKTFEYYSTILPLDESTKVIVSPTFSYSGITSSYTISSLSTATWSIGNLAPTIKYPTASNGVYEGISSRFSGVGLTPITAPTASYDLYLCEYMTIARFAIGAYSVDVGDTIYFQSSVVDTKLLVNKIVNFGGFNYVYMFNDFNQQMITELSTTTYSITLTNLNKYNTIDDLKERYNLHPISIGYKMSIDEKPGSILLDFNLGAATNSYTNWSFSSGFTSSNVFFVGTSSTSATYSLSVLTTGDYFIETPEVSGVSDISFSYISDNSIYSPGTTYSYINLQGLSGSQWYDLNTYVISDGLSGSIGYTVNLSISYNYSKYKFNLKCVPSLIGLSSSVKSISIDDIRLSTSTELVVDSNSYGIENIDALRIEPQFNNYTAYYNLATKVNNHYSSFTMSYTDGFLKFGYTPTYNLLDYLENINDKTSLNPPFYADKQFLAMPEYLALPLPGVSNFTADQLYVDYNGITYSSITGNLIYFGLDRKLEFDSLLINTFVDVVLYGTTSYGASPNYTTERLLITNKWTNEVDGYYIMEFHKGLNFLLNSPLYYIDIKSRRKLSQISYDLQELNNIQRGGFNTKQVFLGSQFTNLERELNYKINTDSYAKIVLSDADVVKNLSAIFYTDYKNEISMNITNLGRDYEIPILNTANFAGQLFISCAERHELTNGEGVYLEFNGGTGSSEILNQQYFGYYPVNIISDYNFTIDLPYGNVPLVGNDTGVVRYKKRDAFFNFQPVDIIDLGIDKKGKQSVELKIENVRVVDNKYSLFDVDFSKYRFRLVDNMNIQILTDKYGWILEAEISGAIIGQDSDGLVWYNGTWECGRWFGGTWISGVWVSGDWYAGTWRSLNIIDNIFDIEVQFKSSNNLSSTWFGGRWYSGFWENGLWVDGRWYEGFWNDGIWYNGIWNDGVWNNGRFTGGIWIQGTWNSGIFNCDNNPSYWLNGTWYSGDFENGMWYNGTFDQRDVNANSRRINRAVSRFGTKAYNSRTATWQGGKWIDGSFYSSININDAGKEDVSDVHKLSIWYTGQWFRGNWYGGIAYNIDFKSGTWYGGILDDIQVIGMNSQDNYFVVNGIFKFNIGDEITITDNRLGSSLGVTYGNNFTPKKYTILYTIEDRVNKWTNIYVSSNIVDDVTPPEFIGLWIVSRFRSANWKSGIWTNGIYESGLWEGGIWYNGVFENKAIWM